MDPRTWDLNQMLAAYETALRQGAKDEAAWNRTYRELTAEPVEVRNERRAAARAGKPVPGRGGMSVGDAETLMARFAASDAQYAQ